jgi:hypothetical protein
MLNAGVLTSAIITSDDRVINLNKDPVYAFEGSEKFINSGLLLSLDKEQNFDCFLTGSSLLYLTNLGCLSIVVYPIPS